MVFAELLRGSIYLDRGGLIELTMYEFLLFAGGVILGMGITTLILRSKLKYESEKNVLEIKACEQVLNNQLQEKESMVMEARQQIEANQREITQMRQELNEQYQERARAEEKNQQIPIFINQIDQMEKKLQGFVADNADLRERQAQLVTRLEEERKSNLEKMGLLQDAEKKLSDTFRVLSSEALQTNNQSFLELAKTTLEKYQEGAKDDLEMKRQAIHQMVQPLQESLKKVDDQMRAIEKERTQSYSSLMEQVKSMAAAQHQLQGETSQLVKSLRTPAVRGRWGEIQLKRVVELAGMLKHCDFAEQQSVQTAEEVRLRPDMIVKLPGGRNVVIDSKTPLQAYLDAVEEADEGRRMQYLRDHASQVKNHIQQLSSKSYWEQFQPTPEFAVLFLPGESFFSAALEYEPGLIEYGAQRRVVVATPTTLIALLRSIAYGWKQEEAAQNAYLMSAMGKELYERIRVLADHFVDLRKGLERALDSYNKAAGSLDTRVLVTARKFKEMGVTPSAEIENPGRIDKTLRRLNTEFTILEAGQDG